MRRALVLPLAFLAACTGEAWTYTTPPVVDEAALRAELRPRGAEKLVLANFWASW